MNTLDKLEKLFGEATQGPTLNQLEVEMSEFNYEFRTIVTSEGFNIAHDVPKEYANLITTAINTLPLLIEAARLLKFYADADEYNEKVIDKGYSPDPVDWLEYTGLVFLDKGEKAREALKKLEEQ